MMDRVPSLIACMLHNHEKCMCCSKKMVRRIGVLNMW